MPPTPTSWIDPDSKASIHMLILLLFFLVFLFVVMGLPVGIALAGSSLIFILIEGRVPDLVVLHRMVNGVDSFPLLAVPFFILAGNLMNTAGITNRIFTFAKACVGWMRGGLGHVNVGASVVFAGMSGAAVADAGGLGTRCRLRCGFLGWRYGCLFDDWADHSAVTADGHLRRRCLSVYRSIVCRRFHTGLADGGRPDADGGLVRQTAQLPA
mgnify:CR=1 FL=1